MFPSQVHNTQGHLEGHVQYISRLITRIINKTPPGQFNQFTMMQTEAMLQFYPNMQPWQQMQQFGDNMMGIHNLPSMIDMPTHYDQWGLSVVKFM